MRAAAGVAWISLAAGVLAASHCIGVVRGNEGGANSPTLLQLGQASLMHKNPAKAEEYFLLMTCQAPQDPKGWGSLAVSLILQGRNAEAEKALARAIALDPNNAQFRANRAQALRAVQRLPEAIAEARESVSLDPSNPLFSNRLLLMRIQNGESEAVKQEIHTWQSSGLASMKATWILAAAALAAIEGNMTLCTDRLAEASPLIPPDARKLLLSDPVFVPMQSKILAASPRKATQPPRRSPVFLPFR